MENEMRKLAQLREMKCGQGIQSILDRAYAITGNPMLIFDMEYRLIACSKFLVGDDPIWVEFMENGGLGPATITLFRDIGFIDDVANSTKFNGVTYLTSESLQYNRIFGQIYNKNHVPVADLISVECEVPFTEETPVLIRTICDILSEELGSSAYYQDYGRIYQENIFKELVEGRIADKAIYVGHVANIDQFLTGYIFMAVVDISHSDYENTNLVHHKDTLEKAFPNYRYFIYGKNIVILLTAETKELTEETHLQEMQKLFQQNKLYAGISSGFDNLFELQKYYHEAQAALKAGRIEKSTRQIFLFDELEAGDS